MFANRISGISNIYNQVIIMSNVHNCTEFTQYSQCFGFIYFIEHVLLVILVIFLFCQLLDHGGAQPESSCYFGRRSQIYFISFIFLKFYYFHYFIS